MIFFRKCSFVFPLACFLSLSACSDKDSKEPKIEKDTRYEQVHAVQVVKGIDEYLGKGYKGYQFYANPKSCTLSLFDLSDRSVIDIQKAPSYKGRFASGETKTEFYDQFSFGISASGSYDGFSGEITSNFSKETLRNRHYTFATSHITQTYYRLTLLETASLKEEVKADLAALEPFALFDKYGTHYLQSIYIGGRISFSSYVDRASVSGKFDIKATVNAAYAKVVKGSASASSINKADFEQVVSHKQIDVMGGDPAKVNNIMDGSGEPSANYNAWSESVPNYMSISDFADGGMVPIYELVEDAGRREALQKAWTDYMAAHTDDILKEAEPETVKKNTMFYLLSDEDGRYVGSAPYNATYAYYYPTTGDKSQQLQFDGNKDVLKNNNIVKIKTTESFKDNLITGPWSKRVYLGAFVLKHWLYYWTEDGGKTNWSIEKAVPSSDAAIHFGDKVRIRNEHFDQYLAPSKDGFLTTITEPHVWEIKK